MANEQLISNPDAQLLFADHATDFGAAPTTAANSLIVGTPTDVQIDLTGIATDAFWQSAKADFGATRSPLYRMDACIEFTSAAVAGEYVDFFWAASNSGTAGTGNAANITGADGSYTETNDLLAQLTYIGSLTCDAATIVIGFVGFLIPSLRYGSLVVGNRNTTSLAGAGVMDETHIVLTPMTQGT